MNSNKALLLISASGLLLMPCGISLAAYLPLPTLPDAITSVYNTHFTHTSHPEEMLLSSAFYPLPENSGNYLSYPLPKDLGRGWGGFHNTTLTQLAATCFVTDTSACSGNEFSGNNADDDGVPPGGPGDGDDYDLDNAERCRQEGYNQTSCPEGQEPSNTCPYDSTYFEKCVSSCPSNYVTCELPYYGVGEACDGKYASCEKDTERACQELNPGYVDECGTGQQLSDDRCSYDNTYGTCCNTCAGYDNTSIPEGYVQDGESCLGCDGQEHYKIEPNPCDGFMDCGSMGGEADAKTCLSGTSTMYDNCKATNCTNYCNPPTTDCQALGYKRDTCTGRALKCPYNSAYVLCL